MKREYDILIVDDDSMSRDILSGIFSDSYEILQADNGKDALEIVTARCESIAVILLDLVMPEMDGFAFLHEMQVRNLLTHIPVVVTTADTDSLIEARILNAGVSDLVPKPFVPQIVRQRVENVIAANYYRHNLEYMTRSLSRKLERSNEIVVDTLSSIIEHRSLESGQHIKRLRSFTRILLEELAQNSTSYVLDENAIDCMSRAATLHDIGKIVIPDSILNKPGRFTPEEFEVMKSHTVEGANIIKKLTFIHQKEYLEYAWQIAMYHHERWDGNGYPCGLKGDEIPLCAQAVGIADVYDALTTIRVYKDAFSHRKAIMMIIAGECGVFSEEIKHALLAVAPKFEELARQYRDGEIELEDFTPFSESTENDLMRDALHEDHYKFLAAIQYIGGTVVEVDYNNRTYEILSKNKDTYGSLNLHGDFQLDSKIFIDKFVHPLDCYRVTESLMRDSRLIENGRFRKRTIYARMRKAKNKPYAWVELTQVRIDIQGSAHHRTLIIMRNVDEMAKAGLIKDIEQIDKKSPIKTDLFEVNVKKQSELLFQSLKECGFSEGMLYDTLKKMCDIFFVFNINSGRLIIDCSDESFFMNGIPNDVADIVKRQKFILHPDDEENFYIALEMALLGTCKDEISFRMKDKNGKYNKFHAKFLSAPDAGGVVSHITGIMFLDRSGSD